MFTADSVISLYARNLVFLNQHVEGLSQTQTLTQPPVPGNCVNWVVGHIALYRNRILHILGFPPAIDPAIVARYGRDSKPVLGPESGLGQTAEMVAAINQSQNALAAGLRALSGDAAAKEWEFGALKMTAAEWMLFLLRHEAMHGGNLELLREISVRA